jgi:hypothetical protein
MNKGKNAMKDKMNRNKVTVGTAKKLDKMDRE